MSAFSRQHYCAIAAIMQKIENPKTRADCARDFDALFKADNPRYDSGRFMTAAGVSK